MKYLSAIVGMAIVFTSSNTEAATLIVDGKSEYVITLPRQSQPQEQTAARELQEFLRQVSGAELPIRDESQVDDDTPQLVVGESQRAQRLVPDARLRAPGPDGICIQTVGRHLVLTGAPPRGTLYAVYTFLEDVVGCRWWTSTEATIPRKPTLEIPEIHRSYAPKLISREAFYRDAFASPFAARLKLNGHFMEIPREFGGHLPILGWCHTFFQILPPATHFGEHPEWYSEIAGKRSGDTTQLCLANEAMRQEFVRRVLELLSAEEDPRIISVSQNDWGGRCQCQECAASESREGSPAGPLLQFVNAVAEEVEKKYPDVLVETLGVPVHTERPSADQATAECADSLVHDRMLVFTAAGDRTAERLVSSRPGAMERDLAPAVRLELRDQLQQLSVAASEHAFSGRRHSLLRRSTTRWACSNKGMPTAPRETSSGCAPGFLRT